jgi:hypothetical protein
MATSAVEGSFCQHLPLGPGTGENAQRNEPYPIDQRDQLSRLIARGWQLFPVTKLGKQPAISNWQQEATDDMEKLGVWSNNFPECNWGAMTGPKSHVFVLDVDGEPGAQALRDLQTADLTLPATLTTSTGRGFHLWFQWPTEGKLVRNSAGKLAIGLDVRGLGGYVIVPPSVHSSHAAYKFVDESLPIATAPEWLLERLTQGITTPPHPALRSDGIIREGQRNSVLTSFAGAMRRKGMSASAIGAALSTENRQRCEPPLSETEIAQIAQSVSRYDSKPFSEQKVPRRPKLLALSEVTAREVAWIWKPYLAERTLAMLTGDPGAGKTFVSLAIAAAITVGSVPCTGETSSPANVFYLSVENSPDYVVRPRFDSLGGDAKRFTILDGAYSEAGELGGIKLSEVDTLRDALRQTQARLVIVDPIQSYLGAEVDAHRSNETRPVMDGLSRLCEEHGCCILLVRHVSKAQTGKAIHRGLGSIDLTGAVRTELLAGSSPNDPSQRALVQLKSNLGRFGTSVGYSIGGEGIFTWTGESRLTAEMMLSSERYEEATGSRTEAEEFLLDALATGARSANDLIREAEQMHVCKRTLMRAKKKLGVRSTKQGMAGTWEWSLPEGGHP